MDDPNKEADQAALSPDVSDKVKIQFGKMAAKFVSEGWTIDNGEGSDEDTPRITLRHPKKKPVLLWIEEVST